MRMLRSFILRLALILSSTMVICLLLMAVTLAIQELREGMVFCWMLFGLALVWFLVNLYVVRKVDPELSVEVGRILLPSGAVLSLMLSWLMALYLQDMIPGEEGKQHLILLFAGIGVATFLLIRCFDIKWLRAEEEIVALEERLR